MDANNKETIIMMIKLVRIGKDAELRSANGRPVLSLSVVYDVGYGTNKKSQWLNLAMWGAQAEKTVQYFTKGKQLVVRVDDVHIERGIGSGAVVIDDGDSELLWQSVRAIGVRMRFVIDQGVAATDDAGGFVETGDRERAAQRRGD